MQTLNLSNYKTTYRTKCKKCGERFMLFCDKEMQDYAIQIWKRFESMEHYQHCLIIKRNVWENEA